VVKVWSVAIVVALGLTGLIGRGLAPRLETEAHYTAGDIEQARESVAVTVLGQFQMMSGDLMWLKTFEYLHSGIIYRMPTRREEAAGVRATEFSGMGSGVAHMDGPSLVPDQDRDWRSVLGDLDRQIEPWRPGAAEHSDPKELIPWYQLLTKFNPHYVQAYTTGAFFMSDFAREPTKALAFLELGAKPNPWSFEIQSALGKLHFDYFKQYDLAADALAKSVELAKEEKAYLARRGGEFDEKQEQMLAETYLFLARSYEELGEYDKGLAACDAGLAEDPTYNLLRVEKRIINKQRANASSQDDESPI